ncbi:MAG: CoA-acylating methylmalonate-semialdehyde dehydrogenase [Candidatus Acetothermia bacterium]|jgi:malonate-semialdehyde dehydrogenase (acetylating)/methylmalonate-semialdehyde dehydrogenase|nr:CoA-acylating methylmalonate-semialdehyde dehydrogenase [Candidatus Acetothermia bacterium]MDH7504691.1 CoA-acylating methylmalonate-semialdehyde dehydrogenase [Candidatus Acetothermia bacterium]
MDRLKNYIGGEWRESKSQESLEVRNPATEEVLAQVPLSTDEEVEAAIRAACEAFPEWRETPPTTRIQYLFRLKGLLEDHFEALARTISSEEGKTLDEARGEMRRLIENVEVATGIPSLMMGYSLEDIARGIDEEVVRQPLGVFAVIPPFNFPAMVPWWFAPYAIAAGNTYIVKPSEQVPIVQNKIFQLVDELDLPPGVLNLVNGAKGVVDHLLESPDVVGISSVTSTPVARYIYRKAAEHGKRVQCQAGAKNFIVVMPDADLDRTIPPLITSFFGCAGERCLSGSVLLPVGEVYEPLKERFTAAAGKLKVGDPLDETVQMGPVISKKHKERVLGYIDRGLQEGARLLLDGRSIRVAGHEEGYFIGPTVFDRVRPEMAIAREEIFGPVASIIRVADLDEAIEIIHANPYGNASSIFTTSGSAAREFKYRVKCGNIGINVGIVAPMAFFPFGGRKDSFFGDLHGQGRDAIDFFTEKKVVITRWW